MQRWVLKSKPLVEAIFELHWDLQINETGHHFDPHSKVLVGSVYSKLRDEYPFHEPLPIASFPDELVPHIVQHRFRKSEDEWPLIQLGPGIITLNDTEEYDWEDFQVRISVMIDTLFEIYPEPERLRTSLLKLRYIDAIDFNYEEIDVFSFLREKMKIDIGVPSDLFQDTGVGETPSGLDIRLSFPSSEPYGTMSLRFLRGQRRDVDALLWETTLTLSGEDSPTSKQGISEWVNGAYALTHDWFYRIIAGELLERFEPCTPP